MAIHFACTQCNKPLFAQEQYAGRPVICPVCQTRNIIPQPPAATVAQPGDGLPGLENETTFIPGKVQTPTQVQPVLEGSPELIDMEKAPVDPALKKLETGAVEPISGPALKEGVDKAPPATASASPVAPESATIATPAPVTPVDADATRRCPICAEKIMAAAKKCRFCGAILDESLRAEDDNERKNVVATGVISDAQRSAATWRALAVLSTGVTIGWLVYLTLHNWSFKEPNMIMLFNPLLIIGLAWNARQMRNGPAHVFFSAALAILLCMPLYIMLGPPFPDAQMQQEIIRQHPEEFEKLKPEQREAMWLAFKLVSLLFFLAIDFVFSLPVWIAMLKVAAAQRLQATLGKPK